MPGPNDKQGPLSAAELLAIWTASVDETYSAPFLAAGDGGGLEVYNQAHAQLARVSTAIDVTTQAMYILPHSAQTNPPASGEAFATVTLTFSRTGLLTQTLHLGTGETFFVEEQVNEPGEDGPIVTQTGRRYELLEDLVFMPGEQGPFTVQAQAEAPGYGYNNPLPGSLAFIPQIGEGFNNTGGTVTVTITSAGVHIITLTSINEADMFVPDHVGQYVYFASGANAGRVGRIVFFQGPDASVPRGSIITIEPIITVSASASSGTFIPGEQVVSGTTHLTFLQASLTNPTLRAAFDLVSEGVGIGIGSILTGQMSGATLTIGSFLEDAQTWNNETGTASWRVLGWAQDWGLTVTNTLSPTGGKLGMLDLLGRERNINRLSGETDDSYRARVATVADVVTPNAIRRMINRFLPDQKWCFREVGTAHLPGIFADRTGDKGGDFYDLDALYFQGTITGTFANGDWLVWKDSSGLVKMHGWAGWGSAAAANGSTIPLKFIPAHPIPITTPTIVTGDTIVAYAGEGGGSGASMSSLVLASTAFADAMRFSMVLDYTQFRAFFTVGVPALDLDDFGVFYDGLGGHVGGHNAYDLVGTSYENFYDGFAVGNVAVYKGLYDALSSIKAGGVGIDLYVLGTEPC